MARSANAIVDRSTIAPIAIALVAATFMLIAIQAAMAGQSSAPVQLAQAMSAPSVVTAAGVTLHSVSADFPDPARMFPGGNEADTINNNCLACHSAGMVLTQPHLSRSDWQAEVDKMRNTYKAPIATNDVPAIVDYLVNLSNAK